MSVATSDRGRIVGAWIVILVTTFLAFYPALSAQFQEVWDDNENITQNTFYRGFSGEHVAWWFTSFRLGHWQPLSWATLALDHALWGMDPFGYHLTNLILHGLAAIAFFHVCRAALAAAGSPSAARVAPALIAALLFAVHPLRVESVVWVTERRDVLSSVFLLLTLLAWLRWRATGERKWYLLALAAYAPALLAKAWGITLPAVLLILDVWPLGRVRAWDARTILVLVREKLPFIALALPTAVLAFLAQRASGAMNYAEDFTVLQKAAQACYGLCFYVLRTLWPARLSPVYVLDQDLDPSEPAFVAAMVLVALATALAIACVLRRRLAPVVTAFAIYVVVVSPVLGLTQSGLQLVADRYSYLATLPFAVLVAALVGRVPGRVAGGVAAVVVLVLGLQTHAYARVWHDSGTLYTHAVEVDPDNGFAWALLGTFEKQFGDPSKARGHFDRAIAADPNSHLGYEGRASTKLMAGDMAGAIADCHRAIELHPECAIPFVNLGAIKSRQNDHAGALADFQEAVRVGPDYGVAWLNLASAHYNLRDDASARAALERCLEIAAPGSPLETAARDLLQRVEARAR